MTGYTKLFSSIVTSTIWRESAETKVVWITMLALADANGEVAGSVPGLAHLAGVTVDECEDALHCLLNPDPYSRTSDYEGRRVEQIDGGWRLLNHGKYKAMLSREERRMYKTQWQRNKRQQVSTVDSEDKKWTVTTHTYTDTDTNTCTKLTTKRPKLSKSGWQLASQCQALLVDEWVNDAGKWVNRIKDDPEKVSRVFSELNCALTEGEEIATRAGYVEDLWKRWE